MYYRDCIINAEKEILISAGFWRPSKVVDIITGALLELNERAKRRGDTSKIVIKIASLFAVPIINQSLTTRRYGGEAFFRIAKSISKTRTTCAS